jgi:hypothetical protein
MSASSASSDSATATTTSDSVTATAAVTTATGPERRVARVERWLSKGFGFATDYGRLDTSCTVNTG